MKEKKRGWRDGTCAPGRELKRGGVPASWEAPSDLRGQKGSFRGSEESTTPICGRQKTPAQTGVLLSCAPARDTCPLVRQGLQLRGECAVPEEDCCWLCGQGLKGAGVRYGCNWGCLQKHPGHHRSQAPLLRGTQRSPSLHCQPLPMQAPGEHTPSLPRWPNKCKSVYTGWISNTVLLFKTGTSIHYAVINHNGKEYNCVTLLYNTFIQHCTSTVLQLKRIV